MIPWHRLFGITLEDFFSGSSYSVEVELDLSLKQQLLDIVIIEKKEGKAPAVLPDGFENLAAYNLITYKSHQQSMDVWSVRELCGHYVNYRKKISPSFNNLIDEAEFNLYAVSTKYPAKLGERVDFEPAGQGIYDIKSGLFDIRLIVLNRIAESERNAPWLMFSAEPEKVKYGADHYEWRLPVSLIVDRLFEKYKIEGVTMPYTSKDFLRDVRKETLKSLNKEDIEKLLSEMDPEDRLKGLKPEDRLKGLKPEDRLKGLKPEDRLKGLKPDEVEEYLKRLKQKKGGVV